MRALLSVTDKTGIVDLARGLHNLGFEIVSTGGTASVLSAARLPVTQVAEVTGRPEMLDGRVKTLDPMIHGAILADLANPSHLASLAEHGIHPISVVVVNLYAFEATVTATHNAGDAVESIDIGGPAMIRAAAKNHAHVAVVVDPEDYGAVLESLRTGAVAALRAELAAKAFRHTAFYDSIVSRYLTEEPHPETLTLGYRLSQPLRYGENPHMNAALYTDPLATGGIARSRIRWGKALSFNNLLDSDAAWELACDLPREGCAIIKHGNPCGVALDANLGAAYRSARACDPISAFGSIAAFTGTVDLDTARAMTEKGNFLEVVVADRFTEDALAEFRDRSGWGQSVRLLEADRSSSQPCLAVRSIRGGVLVTETDEDPGLDWHVVTKRLPTDVELASLKLAWAIVAHVKSNAIVISGADRLLGVGAGQMNRVQSVRLAIGQAGEAATGAALASDAFFPFPDSIEEAAGAGIACIVQPGGSKNDPAVIAAADQAGIAMAFTGIRHFRH